MTKRKSERLPLVEAFYPDHDALIRRPVDIEGFGGSHCDLRCGEDNEIVLRNFTIEEAQNYFRREKARVIIQCPSCGSYNLLAAMVEKREDGSIITFPGGEK